MKTFVFAALLAATAMSTAQPAAAITLRPAQPCGMTALCRPPTPPLPPGGYRP